MCEDYNYADDNTISDVKDTPDELKCLLEHDASNVTDWFDENWMKANTDKYQGIMFGVKHDCPMSFTMKGITVECKDEVKLLGVYSCLKLLGVYAWLTFAKQISFICQKTGQLTDAIMRLSTIIGKEVKLSIYRAFILSNFNYCPVVWMFCGQGNVKNMEHIQLKALCFVYNDFTSSYAELLKKSKQPSISIHFIRSLAIEVYKYINEIAPEYLCSLLKPFDW